MPQRSREFSAPAPVVGLASWVFPGAGYWLLGQRARALTVGFTIIALFFLGLLIGGVRSLEVPGYSGKAKQIRVSTHIERRNGQEVAVTHAGDDVEEGPWVLASHPLDEIRSKPWSIPQIMAGPIDILCSVWSLHASEPQPGTEKPSGTRPHSRTNEIGVLYMAVAGMLNLLTIIDATFRAVQR